MSYLSLCVADCLEQAGWYISTVGCLSLIFTLFLSLIFTLFIVHLTKLL